MGTFAREKTLKTIINIRKVTSEEKKKSKIYYYGNRRVKYELF